MTTFRVTATIELMIERDDNDLSAALYNATLSIRKISDVIEIRAERVRAPVLPAPRPAPSIHQNVAPEKMLLTGEETSEFLNVASQTLAQWRFKGGGPTFLRYGRRVMYRKSDLLAWLAEREYQNTSQPRR